MTNLSPRDRDVAMVFQNYALYPHMTVARNLGYGLRMRKMDKAEISERVQTVASCSASRSCSSAAPGRSPAGSASGSPWAARSCASRARS